MGGGDKTEQATPKRRKDERKKGNVFKSQEIIILGSLLAVLFTIQALGTIILSALNHSFDYFWTQAGTLNTLTYPDVRIEFMQGAGSFLVAALPPLLVAALISVILTIAQTRGLVSFEKIKPKFSNLNPINGIKKMFSMRGIIELLKSILKITLLAYVIYDQFSSRIVEFPRLMEMDFLNILSYGGAFIMDMVTTLSVVYAAICAFDYMYQRWQYEKDLRMSKQEIKEEYKQTEGDPKIKGKIKEKQRQISMSRMMQEVPDADVIVRNPTHYAVALRYDPKRGRAPIVVAKGADLVALRIIKMGEEHDVLIREEPPLARDLYSNVPLDSEIPEEYYGAVAEILAYVYSIGKKKMPVSEASTDAKDEPSGSPPS